MRLIVGTVVRSAEHHKSGALLDVDFDGREVVVVHESMPVASQDRVDANPRGGTRGWRGVVPDGDDLVAADYNALHVLGPSLTLERSVSSSLLAGVHELWPCRDGTVWVTSVNVDAVVRIRLSDSAVIDERWPRNMVEIARSLGVAAQEIDRSVDHRDEAAMDHPGPDHLHLNAVCVLDDHVLALSNSFGAVLDLDSGVVLLRDPRLRGAHNLVPLADGTVAIVNTVGRELRRYDPASGWHLVQGIDLRRGAGRSVWLRSLSHQRSWSADRRFGRVLRNVPRPMFVRGLAEVSEGDLVVGTSPATVLRVEVARGQVVDALRLGGDNHHCVHGLAVLER